MHDAMVVGVSNTITAVPGGVAPAGHLVGRSSNGTGAHGGRRRPVRAAAVEQPAILGLARAARRRAEAARKEAEAELAVAQERSRADRVLGVQNLRFEAALSNMSQALLMFDAAGCLVVVNGRTAEMFGCRPQASAPG